MVGCRLTSERALGYTQAVLGTLAVTPDAVLLRLAEQHGTAQTWVVATCKLLLIGVFCSLQPMSEGWRALVDGIKAGPKHVLVAALLQGLINMGYTLAFLETNVASALMLISLHPMWAALMARPILGDKLPTRTVIALMFAIAAVVVIFVPPLFIDEGGGASASPDATNLTAPEAATPRSTLHGNLIALGVGVSVAATIVVNRHAGMHCPKAGMELAAGVGSLFCGLVSLPIACAASPDGACSDFGDIQPIFWLFISLDALCIATCTILTTVWAPRHLLSAECALILLGEQILSPVWTYLGVGEAPTNWTLAGGALLICTLAVHEGASLVEERREARRDPDVPSKSQGEKETSVAIA